jgi:hypothetical protein
VALVMLWKLLKQANTAPEVMEFMSNHDIDTTVQKNLPAVDVWRVDAHILAFLSVSFLQNQYCIVQPLIIKLIARGCLCQLEDSICNTTSSSNWCVNATISDTFSSTKVKNIKMKDTKTVRRMNMNMKTKNMETMRMRTRVLARRCGK